MEAYFPRLFDSPSARISAFVDFGNVYTGVDNFKANELRVSTGVALLWRAPVGPISISYAFPLKKEDGDEDRASAIHLWRPILRIDHQTYPRFASQTSGPVLPHLTPRLSARPLQQARGLSTRRDTHSPGFARRFRFGVGTDQGKGFRFG